MRLGGLVEKSAAGLGARFGLVGLLPTTLLVLFVLALVWGGAPANPPRLQDALTAMAQYDAAKGLLLVIAILAVALMLQPFQLPLVRLLEGYWGTSRLGQALSGVSAARHRKKREQMRTQLKNLLDAAQNQSATGDAPVLSTEAGRLSERIERFYPKGETLPTTLGNVLRAAEENAGAPYGLDVITVWPRLYALLPARMAALVDDQRNQLDIAVRFSVTFSIATVVSAGLLYHHGWWLSVPAATLALAWISYRGAVASALAYGLGIRTAVDLYRFDLRRALHLPLPKDRETERQTNAELSAFLRQGRPMDFHYDHPPDK